MLVLLFVALCFFYEAICFMFCLVLFCSCVVVFFSPFSIAITWLGGFLTFVRFPFAWFCLFPFPLGVWEGLRFVIVTLPGLFLTQFILHHSFVIVCFLCDVKKDEVEGPDADGVYVCKLELHQN